MVVDAKVCESCDRHGGVEVVEKVGYVEEEDTSDVPAADGHLCFVTEKSGCIGCGVVFPRPELHGADEGEVPLICSQPVSDDFFQKLTCAFQQRYGTVGFGERVVRFVGLRDDDYVGGAPRVCALFESTVERSDDEVRVSFKRPFKEFVGNSRRPWGGFVGGGGESLADFVFGDAKERSSVCWQRGTSTIR
jgi:hypothetical protein